MRLLVTRLLVTRNELSNTDDFIRKARQQNFLSASTFLIHWDKTNKIERNLSLGDDRICRQYFFKQRLQFRQTWPCTRISD